MSNQAIKLIRHCLNTNDTYLDLGNCGLTEKDFIPGTEIDILLAQCVQLQTLILSSKWLEFDLNLSWIEMESSNIGEPNNFFFHPPAIENLGNLSTLICAGENQNMWSIDNMLFVEHFPKMQHLNLSYNRIAEIEGMEHLDCLTNLRLSHNDITEIKGLDQLVLLQNFDISNNRITELKGLHQLISLQVLNIGRNDIRELKGLDRVTSLLVLNIEFNDITELKGLDALTSLQTLNIKRNEIIELKGLDQLTSLKDLDISRNRITELKGLDQLTSLITLRINDNQITELKGLDRLTALQRLDIDTNQITEISGPDHLVSLKYLNLSNNKISELKGLDHLVSLQTLEIYNNKITQLKGLDGLRSLRTLDIERNKIAEIKGLDQLTLLQHLNLGSNRVSELKGLDNLTSLQSLNLIFNEITELKGLDQLKYLQNLNIKGNKISDLRGLDQLTSLQILNVERNKIGEIKGLNHLTLLESLNISDNDIGELKGLDVCTSLKSLNLAYNQLTELKGLDQLTSLKILDVRHNQIGELRGIGRLTNLDQLDLSYNQIQDISPLITLLRRKKYPLRIVIIEASNQKSGEINVINNPLLVPPMEIVNLGNEAVLRYFSQELEAKFEAKILIVGEPEAGKTSMMNKLTNPNYAIPAKEDSTIGIQVIKWSCTHPDVPEPIQLNIWDFGGQEMQYLTHQFFLTSDALYILLTSARKDYDNLDYWFNIISLLGKNENNKNSELLVVANEIKMQAGQANKSFDAKKYQDLYPQLPFNFQAVNLATAFDNDGRFATLRHLIIEKLVQLPILGKQLPVKWGVARKQLTSLNVNYVTIHEYFSICKKHGIEERLALDLSAYLHKIGEAVHFQNDHTIDDYVILNPKWAVDGVYSILRRKEIEEDDGHFTQQQVYSIWEKAGYSYSERSLLLSLMIKDSFEVAYKIPGKKDEYIAPQLLALTQPDYNWNKNGALQFRYFYPFMPKGIITRLIVRMHEAIKYRHGKGLVWRTGVFFEKNGCQAKVEETKIVATGQQVIAIELIGHGANRKLLLYDICRTIEGIHKDSFSKINFERQIPCNCEYCKNLDQPGFYNYSELMVYIEDDIEKIRCKLKPKNELKVKSLLQDIFDVDFTKIDSLMLIDENKLIHEVMFNDPFKINRDPKSTKKIFISYSQKDTRFKFSNGVEINFKDELETHLKSLRRLNMATIWSDTDLLAGEEWGSSIKAQLADADIILFLVSANLIATDYVWNEEMPLAKFHNKNRNAAVIPIILNNCQWQSIPLFSEGNAVPHKAKPVASYNNREEAYDEIIKKIKSLIED